MTKKIFLTESQLFNVISRSVKRILSEQQTVSRQIGFDDDNISPKKGPAHDHSNEIEYDIDLHLEVINGVLDYLRKSGLSKEKVYNLTKSLWHGIQGLPQDTDDKKVKLEFAKEYYELRRYLENYPVDIAAGALKNAKYL